MYKVFRRLLLVFLLLPLGLAAQYKEDILGENFVSRTVKMSDDYDGEVVSTIIKRIHHPDSVKSKSAVLYLHGYNDYFFQKELGDKVDSVGYNFYAVDLRKYGRSLLPNQRQFYVRNLKEYYADLDSAIMTIINDGNDEIVLLGHSTGGLILSLYANDRKNIPEIKALVLNSPFLDMNMSWMMENITVPFVSFVGGIFPNIRFPQSASPGYAHSLLKEYNGEWDYNTEWKLINSPAVTSGWIKAIHNGHKKIHKGLNIDIPVVVMHSDKSFMGDNYTPEFSVSDVVLDVNDIEKYAKGLGSDVKTVTVVNGVHDLILSKKEARDAAYAEIFEVLESQKNNKVN